MTWPADRPAFIRAQLTAALSPVRLEIADESQHHAGHPGAQAGGHYRVTIVSPAFTGLSLVQRHRLIYQAIGDLATHGIHALAIASAATPDET